MLRQQLLQGPDSPEGVQVVLVCLFPGLVTWLPTAIMG